MPPKVKKVGAEAVPPVELVKGMHTRYNMCSETVGAEHLKMGVCHHDADMADLRWEVQGEEAFYIAKGSVKLKWENDAGEKGEAILRAGDQAFLPGGYRYTMSSNGEPAVNVFAVAGGATGVTKIVGEEFGARLKAAGQRL
jgi:uncharacterized RmlC-like cupin family protein